jgi:hypothetical protein
MSCFNDTILYGAEYNIGRMEIAMQKAIRCSIIIACSLIISSSIISVGYYYSFTQSANRIREVITQLQDYSDRDASSNNENLYSHYDFMSSHAVKRYLMLDDDVDIIEMIQSGAFDGTYIIIEDQYVFSRHELLKWIEREISDGNTW